MPKKPDLSHLSTEELMIERDAHWQTLVFWKEERARLWRKVTKRETYRYNFMKLVYVRGPDADQQFESALFGWLERCRDGFDVEYSIADRHVIYHAGWVTAAVQELTRRATLGGIYG